MKGASDEPFDMYACSPMKSLFLPIYESQVARQEVDILSGLYFDFVWGLGKSVGMAQLLCKRWNIHLEPGANL